MCRRVIVNSQARKLLDQLSQSARRLRHFENEAQWSQVFIDATQGLCERSALFGLNGQNLELKASRNLRNLPGQSIPLAPAAAFVTAVETRDTVVAMRTRRELSDPIAQLTGEAADRRFSLYPLCTGERVAAILYVDSDDGNLESSALELLATLGAAVLESRKPSQLLAIAGQHEL